MPETAKASTDWGALLEALIEGDALALARLTRLVNGFLASWNAYDFRSDWDDMIQEVLIAATTALQEGRIRDRRAVIGYLRTTARFKFVDRLKSQTRHRENESMPWEDVIGSESLQLAEEGTDSELTRDLAQAIERLPEKQRLSVVHVHLHGKTYEQAAKDTKIPLGSLKRFLREGLTALREDLSGFLDSS
ncbi:RNA polymerase sigma factor [Myxococcota bacterium]|nr:RNA polymerase sigma factor [Myxococcota bacterium]